MPSPRVVLFLFEINFSAPCNHLCRNCHYFSLDLRVHVPQMCHYKLHRAHRRAEHILSISNLGIKKFTFVPEDRRDQKLYRNRGAKMKSPEIPLKISPPYFVAPRNCQLPCRDKILLPPKEINSRRNGVDVVEPTPEKTRRTASSG